ncbi:MAG: hypothetical protein PHP45_06795, partial [Elusimicrobiales bacterium]|nr:hypothetical protein [Elusimicrobiales bacterium]
GTVPGPRGQPVPAIVHGGEHVLSLRDMDALGSVNTGSVAAVAGGNGGNMTLTLNAPITIAGGINSQMDARVVAQELTAAMQNGVNWGISTAKAAYKAGRKHDGEVG